MPNILFCEVDMGNIGFLFSLRYLEKPEELVWISSGFGGGLSEIESAEKFVKRRDL